MAASGGEETELSRDLGLFAVFTTATGTMIGAGIFILPGVAAAHAGPSSALSFIFAGLIALVATFAASELATAMPQAGGSYFFVSRAMGPLIGTVVGLGAWISLLFKGSFALVGLAQYIQYFSPVPVLATAVAAGLLLILLNWVGAEKSGALQNVVVIGLIVILAGFAGRGLFAAEQTLLTPFLAHGWLGVIETTGLVFISYLGIVKATAIAEEVHDPGRNLPYGMIGSVIFVTVLYVLIMLIVTGVLTPDQIADSPAPVADTGTAFLGALGGMVIALAGILATLSTANAAILSSARFPFAMARDGLMTPKLRASSRFQTPGRAIWLTGILMVGMALIFDVEGLAKLGGTFGILVFVLLNVTVVLLQAAQPEWYDPGFTTPLSPALPLAGAAAALLLIPFMGLLSQVGAVVFTILGIGWYYLQNRVGEEVTPGYGLADQLQQVQHVKALEAKEETLPAEPEHEQKIIVEVVEEQPNNVLISLAAAFADAMNARLDVVIVSEVPYQVPLSEYEKDISDDWLEKLESRLEDRGCEFAFHHVLARDRTQAIRERADDNTTLVFVDWHDPVRIHHLRESHVDEMLREATKTRVAVLKHRGATNPDSIVVATEGGPYDQAEVELADAIATYTDAELSFVKIVPPDAEEQRANAERYLDDLAELVDADTDTRVIEAENVENALIREGDAADLLVMGAPSHPGYPQDFFGQTTDIVAANTASSVLVVKEAVEDLPWYRRIWRRLFNE